MLLSACVVISSGVMLANRGGDSFTSEGFSSWSKKHSFEKHVGPVNSFHNQAVNSCYVLMKPKQHVRESMDKQTEDMRSVYRTRLTASLDCLRFLMRQGMDFRGHDESPDSPNQGNFLELLKFLASHNEEINNVARENAPDNHQLTCPDIQSDLISVAAFETTKAIISELGDDLFSILVDESRDVSGQEQMAVVLRFVNEKGHILERFIGVVHVSDTSARSLKVALESLLCKHDLSLARIRGQCYNGVSNMQGAFNGLKTLVMRESSSAYYVHCFAHQLQLTLIAVAKNEIQVAVLFNLVGNIVNVVGGSCKRLDMLREIQIVKVREFLGKGKIQSGRGLNQKTSIKRHGDTRWGSHFGTLMNLVLMFSSIIDVLEIIKDDGASSDQRAEANRLLESMQSFEFVFTLHLMKTVLGITNELSQALQKKDQDIVNAIRMVIASKERLQTMRDERWDALLNEVTLFCKEHDIDVPNMDEVFLSKGRRRREAQPMLNLDRYRVDLFYVVLDKQLQELNDRFNEVSTELLICVACFSPENNFSAFDKDKLTRLAEFYPCEFSPIELMALDNQLQAYIVEVRKSGEFSKVTMISTLAKKLVETKRHIGYPLVYLLLKLALLLPVATATVERAFSAMKIVKTRLRNRMRDDMLNDCLVTYIEKDIFESVDNELVLLHFQNMKTRRGVL